MLTRIFSTTSLHVACAGDYALLQCYGKSPRNIQNMKRVGLLLLEQKDFHRVEIKFQL